MERLGFKDAVTPIYSISIVYNQIEFKKALRFQFVR